ncbi:unnamed protein product [Lepidochelys kempii]
MGASKRIERIYFEISETNKAQWEMPQVKESKRQFIFDVVNEGGESEKMELFVNFCEDTIFEMQIAAQISEEEAGKEEEEEEEGEGGEGTEVEKAAGAPPEATSAFGEFLDGVLDFFRLFTYRNLRRRLRRLKKMTVKELAVGVSSCVYAVLLGALLFFSGVLKGVLLLLWTVLFGGGLVEGAKKLTMTELLASMPDPTQDEVHGDLGPAEDGQETAEGGEAAQFVEDGKEEAPDEEEAFRLEMKKDTGHYRATAPDAPGGLGDMGDTTAVEPPTPEGTPIIKRKLGLEGEEAEPEPEKMEEPPAEAEKADTENGEKVGLEEPAAPQEPAAEAPRKHRRKSATPRERKEEPANGSLEFWAELEIQRVKFLNYLSGTSTTCASWPSSWPSPSTSSSSSTRCRTPRPARRSWRTPACWRSWRGARASGLAATGLGRTRRRTAWSISSWRRARATCSPRCSSCPSPTRWSPSSASSATTASRSRW